MSWTDVHRTLSHADGLTGPFATMYLLAFAYHGDPEVELGLARGHGLRLKDGRPLKSDRVVREVVPLAVWPDDVGGQVSDLRRPTAISWNGALLYISCLAPQLREIDDEDVSNPQQDALALALSNLSDRLDRCQSVVNELSQLSDASDGREALVVLERLRRLSSSQDFAQLYQQSRRHFGSPVTLAKELLLLDRIEALEKSLPDLLWTQGYLNRAVIQGDRQELSLVRMALTSQLTTSHLLGGDTAWRSCEVQFERFRQDYARAYRNLHGEYHRRRAVLTTRLEAMAPQLAALSNLNSIQELGEPVGQGLEERHRSLKETVKVCAVAAQDLTLDLKPRCDACDLALGEELPQHEVELFHSEVRRSLVAQTRRLSQILVGRILHGQSNRRLDDFLKIVQASDLSSLVNTLDQEMVMFIRRLVSTP